MFKFKAVLTMMIYLSAYKKTLSRKQSSEKDVLSMINKKKLSLLNINFVDKKSLSPGKKAHSPNIKRVKEACRSPAIKLSAVESNEICQIKMFDFSPSKNRGVASKANCSNRKESNGSPLKIPNLHVPVKKMKSLTLKSVKK